MNQLVPFRSADASPALIAASGESNLRVRMARLRKAFEAYSDVIKTVPGRGYIFTVRNHELARTGATRTIDRLPRPSADEQTRWRSPTRSSFACCTSTSATR
jgi:DNA-binding winged helix-turn-helix (wHTH) protein